MEENNNKETEKIKVKSAKEKTKKEPKVKKKKENDEVIRLTEEVASLKEKNLRFQAEMMNFKKRQEEEVSKIRKYKNEDILKSLLNVMDNFDRALSFKTEENAELFKGFEMIGTSITNILKDNEVEVIISDDVEFDPSLHQAVFAEKKEGVEPGRVIETLQKGYMYKDRVLRPSMVKVSE